MLISVSELAARVDDPAVRVLDCTVFLRRPVRRAGEVGGGPYVPESGYASYAPCHIPGAGFADLVGALASPSSPLPFALPSASRFASGMSALGVGPSSSVVLYAQESPMWATRLWWLLRYFGFDSVSVLDGGLGAWRAAGLPVTSDLTAVPAASFVASPRPSLLATRGDVASGSWSCLVNALAPSVFRGEGVTSYSRPGRIPGSVNAPAGALLDGDTGCFLPASSLRPLLASVLEAAGADAPAPVAYCGGGISATVVVFALALLGRDDVRLYDGSLAEWSADPALPLDVG
jgi:thiosulfate/3-mercaptopyruvate sulfurtransferase